MITRYAFTRTYNQTKHAANRSKQRYGFKASPALLIKICDEITTGRAEVLSAERNVYRVDLSAFGDDLTGVRVIVAYDRYRKNVRSFLPSDWTVERADAWDKAKADKLTIDGWKANAAKSAAQAHKAKVEREALTASARDTLDAILPDYTYTEDFEGWTKLDIWTERERIKAYRLDQLKPLLEYQHPLSDLTIKVRTLVADRLRKANSEISELQAMGAH